MKVIPRIKSKKLAQDEARVIIADKTAIEELLLENLMEHKSNYFNIRDVADDCICIMKWEQDVLIYAVMPIKYCLDGYELDIDRVRKIMGATTDSFFKPNRYRSMKITEDMLSVRHNKTGDDSLS